jgi:hypothetical protein
MAILEVLSETGVGYAQGNALGALAALEFLA